MTDIGLEDYKAIDSINSFYCIANGNKIYISTVPISNHYFVFVSDGPGFGTIIHAKFDCPIKDYCTQELNGQINNIDREDILMDVILGEDKAIILLIRLACLECVS
ncbi:hypothetical protein MXB_2054 [Myxobolus squamalis]|nr:hypothetical protein MXB_2054 [Myxobolus squamalis]